jgi:RimJ/RimL family protein N-acetyltransferase
MATLVITTPRMILRPWRDEDYAPYAALNADPEVRRYWPATLSRDESDAQAVGLQKHIDEHGFGFWAVELPGVASFIGFVGLQHAGPDLPFAPAVEAGWRLARDYWGCGYATEGARAALADGFGRLGLEEIVSYAVAVNAPSRRVMERFGMTHDPAADFDHKDRNPNDPLCRHVVYRKRRDEQ